MLYRPHLGQLTVLWDLLTKSEQWTGTLWGDTNKMLNISYLHFLSLGRTIQSSLVEEQKTKTVRVTYTLKECPACLCVWHQRERTNPSSVSLAVPYNRLHAYTDVILNVQRARTSPLHSERHKDKKEAGLLLNTCLNTSPKALLLKNNNSQNWVYINPKILLK